MFSDKYLKKWYLLPVTQTARRLRPACQEG